MRFGFFALIAVCAGLMGCGASTPTTTAPQKFDSASYAPMALNARRLEIVENWQMPMQEPYIGHFQTPYPSNMVAKWAAAVLQPAGGSGELVLDISTASVTREKLPQQTDLKGLLTDQQDTRVKVVLEANLMWIQPVGGARAMVNLVAAHSTTVPESTTPNAFNIAVRDTLLAALAALDKEARKEIRKIDNIVLP